MERNDLIERRWIGERAGQPAKATRMEQVAEIWRDQGLIVTEWVPAATITSLSEALAEAEKEGAAEVHAVAVFLSALSSFQYGFVSREAIDAIHHFTDSIPDERQLPAPPRDLSQGGQP